MKTILVDRELCTRCGICSIVCPQGIILPSEGDALPHVSDVAAGICSQCGHCEVYCPSEALLLNVRPTEKMYLPHGAGTIPPEELGYYMRKRRSVRHYRSEGISEEKILKILDIARYAPSGMNGQPVEWIVVHDPERVKRIAGLTIEWMKTLVGTDHPMSGFAPVLIGAWESGHDVICRGAPHLLFAHIPKEHPIAFIDAIIALSHFEIAAPAFGIGACWAGFVTMAATSYGPLQKELPIPEGRQIAYGMFFGAPRYEVCGIPRRKPLGIVWI